ncbi:hypothetical protein EJ06DRAFT_550666 [Trichodelitschia bisporula]|uniref:Uncharacterized protein n=1 Tax=Trichodelitschia bisporula TaxID=703511 RepID=A0A6G1HNM2_9PEZI|nr:hypothetical protein EJ06DRAFT_550666 [Trichodelitschia bisporula]
MFHISRTYRDKPFSKVHAVTHFERIAHFMVAIKLHILLSLITLALGAVPVVFQFPGYGNDMWMLSYMFACFNVFSSAMFMCPSEAGVPGHMAGGAASAKCQAESTPFPTSVLPTVLFNASAHEMLMETMRVGDAAETQQNRFIIVVSSMEKL